MTGHETDFLYPFLDRRKDDATRLLADLAVSARAKGVESARLVAATLAATATERAAVASALAERLGGAGRMFVFGNGGSATDAAGIVTMYCNPPRGRPLRARSLVAERAVVTALGNDVGFDRVYSRQVIAHGRPGDVALGVSTSGHSTNVLEALAEARRRGLLTVGLAGYDGGEMATSPYVDHCLVVASQSVHRIQETQAALAFDLWNQVQDLLAAGSRP